jgi:hypothetical protein
MNVEQYEVIFRPAVVLNAVAYFVNDIAIRNLAAVFCVNVDRSWLTVFSRTSIRSCCCSSTPFCWRRLARY